MTLKTRSGVKKRVKLTGTGKIKLAKSCKRHLLSGKTKKAKKRDQYGKIISSSEVKKIKQQLPHGV